MKRWRQPLGRRLWEDVSIKGRTLAVSPKMSFEGRPAAIMQLFVDLQRDMLQENDTDHWITHDRALSVETRRTVADLGKVQYADSSGISRPILGNTDAQAGCARVGDIASAFS